MRWDARTRSRSRATLAQRVFEFNSSRTLPTCFEAVGQKGGFGFLLRVLGTLGLG
jgi:hypothetical protein